MDVEKVWIFKCVGKKREDWNEIVNRAETHKSVVKGCDRRKR